MMFSRDVPVERLYQSSFVLSDVSAAIQSSNLKRRTGVSPVSRRQDACSTLDCNLVLFVSFFSLKGVFTNPQLPFGKFEVFPESLNLVVSFFRTKFAVGF